jgi:hypothetical protein
LSSLPAYAAHGGISNNAQPAAASLGRNVQVTGAVYRSLPCIGTPETRRWPQNLRASLAMQAGPDGLQGTRRPPLIDCQLHAC